MQLCKEIHFKNAKTKISQHEKSHACENYIHQTLYDFVKLDLQQLCQVYFLILYSNISGLSIHKSNQFLWN